MLVLEVNGRPLHLEVAPVVERGRVLLPARAVFAALGATVDFDPATGRVDVRRSLHFLRVTLNSTTAFIDNAPVSLPTPARERDGVTLLPLRFVAEALGGRVRYFPARSIVDVEDPQAPGSSPARLFQSASRPPRRPGVVPAVNYRLPAPGEFVNGGFPSISALFRTRGARVDPSSVRLLLDGQDVTEGALVTAGAVGYTPALELQPGQHQVTVLGADVAGRHFASTWTFASIAVSTGSPPGVVGYQAPAFTANGTDVTALGGSLLFALTVPPSGRGYITLCGYSAQYPLQQAGDPYHYVAKVTPPPGLFAPRCQAAGFFFDRNGGSTYFTLPTPLRIDTRPKD